MYFFQAHPGELEVGTETKDGKSVGSALSPLFDQLLDLLDFTN